VRAGGIMLAFALAMLLVRLFWMRILGPLVRRTETQLDDAVLLPLRGLVLWGLLLLGLYQAAMTVESVRASAQLKNVVEKMHAAAWVVLAIWTTLRIFNGMIGWYVRKTAAEPAHAGEIGHHVDLARKVFNVVVVGLGLLFVLRVVGVDISPLLAGGAIGGLAIALALQDTLSNLFAGLYVTIDKPVSVGDFIRLESGDEGFVEEIGWRNTRIRLWANNLVVIPNSKLSQSVITNYFLPQQEMSLYVPCGVAYDSDLEKVERVTVEVAKEVMRQVEGSALDWEPVVRWKDFGDFAITFVTVLRVSDFAAQYKLRSEFIKTLHRRFQQEGIEIPFPIRTVVLKTAREGAASASQGAERNR
jgi:small-conductance mechanosensitive channel